MRKISLICSVLLLLFAVRLTAQDSNDTKPAAKGAEQPAHFYHLQFVVQELNEQGKPVNSRTFTTIVKTGDTPDMTRIRTGSRIPVATGSFQSSPDNKTITNTQYQYIDAGVNIDVQRMQEIGRQLAMNIHADISSIAPTGETELHQPVVRQNRWEATVLIPVGKPAVIFSSDTLESKGSMQVVVTATPQQ